MKVDVYYSGRGSTTKLLVVPAGMNVPGMTFPHDPDLQHRDLNGLRALKYDVSSDLVGAIPGDVAEQIQAKGYAVCSSVAGSDEVAN